MKFLQKLGKSLMLPVACLPICAIFMGIGYLLCPVNVQNAIASGSIQVEGFCTVVGFYMVKAGGALISNIAILFAIGVGVGMSDESNGTGALASLASWLIMTTMLSRDIVSKLLPSFLNEESLLQAFDKINNPFIGILAGLIGAFCYNKFKDTKLPDFLSFFSGKRSVTIVAALVSLVFSVILMFIWPLVFLGLTNFGKFIATLGPLGASIYAVLNRLLIPFGLHHALNNVFWFDTAGLGDITNFWAGKTSADVSWDLGSYMSGFFAPTMFGIAGAALAMILLCKKENRKKIVGFLMSAALCAFICGVTEPFEFSFMFLCFPLYIVYAVLYGIFTYIALIVGFRAGFSFSAGLTDLLCSASMPAAKNTLLIIPLGIGAFVVFFVVFYIAIKFFKAKVPGSTAESSADIGLEENSDFTAMAAKIIIALGGKDNIVNVDNCITRLRLDVKDSSVIDDEGIKSSGAGAVIHMGKTAVQIVVGTKVQSVADEMKRLITSGEDLFKYLESNNSADDIDSKEEKEDKNEEKKSLKIYSPLKGTIVSLENIPDETFKNGYMGEGLAVTPDEETVYAVADGEISMVAETKHAVSIMTDIGAEILIHCGIDTVNMKGEGFEVFVSENDKVKRGDKLLSFSKEVINKAKLNDMVVVTVTNSDDYKSVICEKEKSVTINDEIIKVED